MTPANRARLVGVALVGGRQGPAPDRLSVLRGVDLFKWCTDDELLAFVGLTRPQRYREGELLLRQGSVNTTLFLLVSGTVGVNKDGQRIARTGAGSIFGEMSMLDEPRASATVEALSEVEVLTIARDAFLQALKKDATMAVKVLWSMLLRVSSNLRVTSQRLAAATAARPVEEET
jgi:CRP-like cAMP-binding protein